MNTHCVYIDLDYAEFTRIKSTGIEIAYIITTPILSFLSNSVPFNSCLPELHLITIGEYGKILSVSKIYPDKGSVIFYQEGGAPENWGDQVLCLRSKGDQKIFSN